MSASLVLTHSGAMVSVSLRGTDHGSTGPFAAEALVLRQSNVDAVLVFQEPLNIPADLLNRDSDLRFKTLAEIRSDVDLEARRSAESLRQRLRDEFTAKRSILVTKDLQATQTFFGLTFVGDSILEASAEISPSLLDQDDAGRAEFFIRAEASAVVTVQVNLQDAADPERQKLVLAVAAAGAGLTARMNIDVPTLASFDLKLPEFKLPNLKFDDIDFAFGGIPSFGLGSIPLLGDVKARWDTEPRLKLVVADGSMSVTTAPLGEASVFIGDMVPANRILHLTNVDLKGSEKLAFSAKVDVTEQEIPTGSVPDIPAGPFTVRLGPGKIDVAPVVVGGVTKPEIKLTVTLDQLVVACANDPKLTLPLKVGFEVELDTTEGGMRTKLTTLELRPPYPLNLLRRVGELVGNSIRIVGAVQLPQLGMPDVELDRLKAFLERLGEMLGAAAQWLADQAGAAGGVLVGIGESIRDALLELYRKLAKLDVPSLNGPSLEDLVIEVRLDAGNWSLRQICIMPSGKDVQLDYKDFANAVGFDFGYSLEARPSLVLDVKEQWLGVGIRTLKNEDPLAVLATDLWISRESSPAEPLNLIDEKSGNKKPSDVQQPPQGAFGNPKRLLSVMLLSRNTEKDLVLVALKRGEVKVFQTFDGGTGTSVALGADVKAVCIPEDSRLVDARWDDFFSVKPHVDVSALKDALLNLFPKADPGAQADGESFIDKLGQYVKVTRTTDPEVSGGKFTMGLVVQVVLGKDITPEITLNVEVDLRTFSARLTGADRISLMKEAPFPFSLLGLNVELDRKVPGTGKYEALALDLRGGRQSFGLGNGAKATITYGAVATSGRGLVFDVPEFQVASNGLTLQANISPEPVTLGGVDVPFKFTSGGISIRQSKLLGGSLAGSGQLPRALIGEANANIALSLIAGEGGGIEVESAEARLDKAGDPIVCESTRFRLDITELGMGFAKENAYHFYFLLTGSARFTPARGEATEGLLKQLGNLEIQLKKTPLTSDARVLMRSISFQVKCEPPKTGNFFDIFKFELRGIGFHPSAQAFGGDPAISVSGQVKFAFGDVISSRIDCHQLYIAAAKAPSNFPRVRFDGLTVGLQIGMASIEGTAIAVDEKLPELFSPKTLPANVTAKGFLAAGRIELKGWAPMSASMGFLELRDKVANSAPKHAFYFYAQKNKLAQQIPTPIGTLYLREVGFGFGYRYTLAGIAQAERASSPKELIKILDEVSKHQGSLDSIRAWEPTYGNDGLTLAMRAMFTVAAASTSDSYNAEGEKELPNPLLFDVIAAIRSDLTFLMNVRSWVSVNYADWIGAGENAALKSNPTQRGYLYLSAPRQEFLARFIADGKGHVGNHPPLPDTLKKAIERTRFSATLYLRPGLFHFELGWPYELGIDMGDRNGDFYIGCSGGLIYRIEDAGMLMGIAFRGAGHARFSGRVGGDSLGASASASATFALEAKVLAYLSLKAREGSMLYGSFQLNVTVAVAVAVWLRFKVWRYTVSLSAGFSLSLSLSVAVELVLLEGAGIGGRAHVAIGVQAFGRSLSLGIGFKFGSDVLELARARVARFMDLGLTVDTPSAETPPATEKRPGLEASRGDRATIADSRTDQEAAQAPTLPPSPQATDAELQEPRASGRVITATHFWALVFPTTDAKRPGVKLYVVQLVPRDHTWLAQLKTDAEASSFYSSPAVAPGPDEHTLEPTPLPDGDFDHLVRFDDAGGVVRIDEYGVPVAPVGGSFKSVMLRHHQVIAPQPGTSGIPLAELLTELFMGPQTDSPHAMTEPQARLNDGSRDALQGDAQARAMRLEKAGRERRNLAGELRQAAEVEERRSAVLGAVVETASTLAARGADASGKWPSVPEGQMECRDFGLTFVMDEAAIRNVFGDGDAQAPPKGKLTVVKRDAAGMEGSVRLFNPPRRHFRERAPRLAGLDARQNASGVTLDWDLEPDWGSSLGAYDDPEFHLAHYTIVRRIHGLKGDKDWQASFRVKGAAPVETDRATGAQTFIRPDMQFVDDFSQPPGIPEELRHMLMGLPVKDGYTLWEKYSPSNTLQIEYLIVPVDIAGTSDVGTPIELPVERPKALLKTPLQARLQVRYNAIPVVGWSPGSSAPIGVDIRDNDTVDYADLGPRLRISMTADSHPDNAGAPAEPDATFLLKIRPDSVIPGGLFGDDALAAALDRPSADDILRPRPGDAVFRLRMERGLATPGSQDVLPLELQLPSGSPDDAWRVQVRTEDDKSAAGAALFAALGLPGGGTPRTVRAFVRRQTFAENDARLPGAWRVMELGIEVRGVRKDVALLTHDNAPTPIDATLDSFEALRAIEYQALRRSDMHVESGRLHLVKPAVDADLLALLEDDGEPLRTMLDIKRRAATRLTWRAQPLRLKLATGTAPEPLLRSLVGGFDLFALDPDLLPGDFSVQDAALDPSRYAQALGRVMMLPASMRGLAPASFGDLGRIESSYPSETCRIDCAARMRRAESRPRLAPWFSPAESTAIFPRPLLRASLFSAPDEALIATLLSKGQPEAIRVRVEGWPALLALLKPEVTCFTAGASFQDEFVFRREALVTDGPIGAIVRYVGPDQQEDLRFTAARLRLLLQSLQLRYERDVDWQGAVRTNPAVFAGVKIVAESLRTTTSGPLVLVTETVEFSPLTRLHPVLADALEFVTYDAQSGSASQPGAIYRRYEIVYDADPQTNATRFAAWQDETPPPRDPYGWGGLRMLGLACGFRLYDTEEGNYVLGEKLLRLVHKALDRAVKRYDSAGHLDLGAPFVDLVCRPWGNSKLFWFDGGYRDLDSQERHALVRDELLATVQISLRPVPDSFASGDERARRPVAYHRFRIAAGATEFTFALKTTGNATSRFYDLLEIGDFAQPKPVRIDEESATLALKLQPIAHEREFIVRVSSPPGAQGTWTDHVTVSPAFIGLEEIARPAAAMDTVASGTDPFGLFEDHLPADWARLLVVKDSTAGYRLGATLDRLDFYAMRRFGPADVLKDATDVEEHVRRNVGFCRAYLEHGDSAQPGERLPFSLGTVADPGTWRVPVDADGSMSIVSVESERFGSRRRYAVRPFGRFEQLSATVPSAATGGGVYRYKPAQGLEGGLPNQQLAWNECFVDATLPRTEPVAKPVILAATRLERERALELVVAHTSDQVLAQANRGTQARVAQHGIGVGFWREFPHRAWAQALAPDVDVLGEFGSIDGEIPAGDLALSITTPDPAGNEEDDALQQLRLRVPDAWMGSWVIRARSMPYFFRIHALVHATAGVMVSEQTGASFAEGFSRLQLPWAAGHHQPRSEAPSYSVRRDDQARRLSIRFKFPTVRFVDCMDREDVALWFGNPPDGIRQVVQLPEPGAGYRVVLQAARSTGEVLAWQPELEVLASPPQNPAEQGDVYIVQQMGERLVVAASVDKPSMTRPLAHGDHWDVELDTRIGKALAPFAEPAPEDWSAESRKAVTDLLALAGDDALKDWGNAAPRGALHVTLARPADWKAFKELVTEVKLETERWNGKLGGLDAAIELLGTLVRIASSDGMQDASWDDYFEVPGDVQYVITGWMVGIPPLLEPLGPTRASESSDAGQRNALLASMAHLVLAEADTLRAFLHRRMRRFHAAHLHAQREAAFDGIAPMLKPLNAVDRDLGAIIEAAGPQLRQVFGVMYAPVSVTLPADPPDLGKLDAVLAILEEHAGAGNAIDTMLAWADMPSAMNVSLALPMQVDAGLRAALDALGATRIGGSAADPVAVALWRPPLLSEIRAMGGASDRLQKLAEEQLFGAGKRPALLVTRGAEFPLDTVFDRKA